MILNLQRFGTEFYTKKLSEYPQISDWEIRNIIEFIEYENKYHRECTIECEDKNILDIIRSSLINKNKFINTNRPKLITECTACPHRKGCVTEFVCHTIVYVKNDCKDIWDWSEKVYGTIEKLGW